MVPFDKEGEKTPRNFRARVQSVQCQAQGEQIVFSIELSIRGCCYVAVPISAIAQVEVDDTAPKPRSGAPLTLYFARKGKCMGYRQTLQRSAAFVYGGK